MDSKKSIGIIENMKLIEIPKDEKKQIVYDEPCIKTDLGNKVKLLFADYTASGRPSPIIHEEMKSIFPYYSNTHSNAFCGILMKKMIQDVREYIHESYNLDDSYVILFTGSGTTGATNHFVNSLNTDDYDNIYIIISSYEHHSNYLPWVEKSKRDNRFKLTLIPPNNDFSINCDFIDNFLKENNSDKSMIIISVTACSNVTGIKNNMKQIVDIKNKYNEHNNIYVMGDYACLGPYEKTNIGKIGLDGFYMSPHKLIGGQQTPGLLVARKKIFTTKSPYAPGGGCVKEANKKCIKYLEDIERKESAGTPNVLGILTIYKALALRDKYIRVIEHNEHEISIYVNNKLNELEKKYPIFKVIFPTISLVDRLPIVCISIDGMRDNLIVASLNDMFGIQTRGGISCSGILGDHIKDTCGIDGWCRISFHWLMSKKDIDMILKGIEWVINNKNNLIEIYDYDEDTHLYSVKKEYKNYFDNKK